MDLPRRMSPPVSVLKYNPEGIKVRGRAVAGFMAVSTAKHWRFVGSTGIVIPAFLQSCAAHAPVQLTIFSEESCSPEASFTPLMAPLDVIRSTTSFSIYSAPRAFAFALYPMRTA